MAYKQLPGSLRTRVEKMRSISGLDQGLLNVRQADRDRKVDQWRAWWRREGDDFLSGGGG